MSKKDDDFDLTLADELEALEEDKLLEQEDDEWSNSIDRRENFRRNAYGKPPIELNRGRMSKEKKIELGIIPDPNKKDDAPEVS